jgi:hypothetical protein
MGELNPYKGDVSLLSGGSGSSGDGHRCHIHSP